MNRYNIFDLSIESDMAIQELPIGGEGSKQIAIRLRKPIQTNDILSEKNSFFLDRLLDGSIDIISAGVAKYSIKDDIINVFPDVDGTIEMARVPFLGVVLATVLARQGWYVLHGSSVSVNGRAVAFIGNKYMGKSTLAASLVRRGHPLITDDVVAIRMSDDMVPIIYPGPFGIKLWPEAIEALQIGNSEIYPLFKGSAKDVLITKGQHQMDPLALDQIYVVGFGGRKGVSRLSTIDGISELMHNEYHNRYPNISSNSSEKLLANCGQLRKRVDMSALIRPVDKHGLDDIAKMVEEHVRSLVPAR
jgi:hypothetical protein